MKCPSSLLVSTAAFIIAGPFWLMAGDTGKGPTTRITPDVLWGEASSSCRIGSLGTDATYVAGEPIDISVVVKNDGEVDLGLYGRNDPAVDQFAVSGQRENGDVIPLTEYGKRPAHEGSDSALLWPPGKTTDPQCIRINRILDLSRAGTYVVTIKTTVGLRGNGTLLTLKSQQIKIKVVDNLE